MPKSRLRRRAVYTPPQERVSAVKVGNPRWLVPVMLACFIIGLLWIVVYYITQEAYPVGAIHGWNMLVGFGLILVGFALAMRWR